MRRKITENGPWMETSSTLDLWGPGTPTFYTDTTNQMMMSIQAWRYPGGTAPGSPNRAENRSQGQIMKTYTIRIDSDYRPHAELIRTDL